MVNAILNLFIHSLAIFAVSRVFADHIFLKDFPTAIMISIAFGIANAVVKPVIQFFTWPINLLSLGLFSLVVNGALVLLIDRLMPGFAVSGILYAVIFSVLVSFITSTIGALVK